MFSVDPKLFPAEFEVETDTEELTPVLTVFPMESELLWLCPELKLSLLLLFVPSDELVPLDCDVPSFADLDVLDDEPPELDPRLVPVLVPVLVPALVPVLVPEDSLVPIERFVP